MKNETTLRESELVLDHLCERQEAIAHAEQTLREQCAEMGRLLKDLKRKYQGNHSHCLAELEVLRMGNECLQQLVAERDQQLAELNQRLAGTPPEHPQAETYLAEVTALRQQVKEKGALIEELRATRSETAPAAFETYLAEVTALRQQVKEKEALIEELRATRPETAPAAFVGEDDRDYEAELSEFRRQLEADRQELNEESQQLRTRNAELNEAAREAELQLSRERAQLARERSQLDRLREEIRQELERAQRDAGVRERLVAVDRLKDEVADRHRLPGSGSMTPPPSAQRQNGSALARWRGLLSS